MASRIDSMAGQSVQNMITCVEEVLRLAGPAKDQLRGLQPYISQLCSHQKDARKQNYEALLAENSQLKDDMLALKSSDGESIEKVFTEMQDTLMRGKDEILRIQAARLQAIQEERRQMQTQLEEMKRTNQTLSSQILSLQNERDELKQSLSDKDHRTSLVEAEHREMQTQLEYMTSTNKTLSRQLQYLQKESDTRAKTVNSKLEEECQALHSELEKIQQNYEQQQKQLHEVLEERETLEKLVARQKQELNTSKGHSKEDYDAVVNKNEQLLSDLLATQSRLEEMKHANQTLSSQIISLQNERDELKQSLSDKDHRTSLVEAENREMQTQVEYMTSTNKTLSRHLQSLQKESDTRAKTVNSKLEEERQALHSELEKIKQNYEQQQKQLHEVLEERETLEKLVARQKQELNTSKGHSKEDYDAVVNKNEQLLSDLLATQSRLEEMKRANQTLSSQIISLQNERDELKQSLSDKDYRTCLVEAENREMQTQVEYMTSTNKILSRQLQSLQKESDTRAKTVNSKLEEERQALHSELEKIKQNYEQQQKQLHEVLEERETLEKLVARQKQELNTNKGHSKEDYDAVVKKNEQLLSDLLATQSRLLDSDDGTLPAYKELTFTDKCNPGHIAELYKNLYKNLWHDALIEGTKIFSVKTDYYICQQILYVYNAVNQFCQEACDRQRVSLEKALSLESENKLLPEYKQLIAQVRCRTTQLAVNSVFLLFQKSFQKSDMQRNDVKQFAEKILPFVQESVRVCWLMNLHDPPLACTQTKGFYGSPFDGNMYECYKFEGDTIESIVWPALLLSKNGPIIAKGVVKCYMK